MTERLVFYIDYSLEEGKRNKANTFLMTETLAATVLTGKAETYKVYLKNNSTNMYYELASDVVLQDLYNNLSFESVLHVGTSAPA